MSIENSWTHVHRLGERQQWVGGGRYNKSAIGQEQTSIGIGYEFTERSEMRRVREYEIWSCPARITVDPDSIVAEIASELGLGSETIIPHYQVPGAVDCQNLRIALAERELFSEDLAKFCSASGYSVNPDDRTVAYHFLNYSYGQSLAWIHLDEKDDHDVERSRIYFIARRKRLAIVDRENLLCLVYFGKDDLSPTRT